MKQGVKDVVLYVGDVPVQKAYKGSVEVYSAEPPHGYDAAVEYLESTGTQYVNLGITPTSSDVITITFRTTEVQSTCFLGCRTTSTSGKCVIGSGTSGTIIYASLGSYANQQLTAFDQVQHTISVNLSTGKASIDGKNPVACGTFANNNLNLFLFGCNQGGAASLFSKIQVMSVEIGERMKLIPVRVGTTGYMYDEVSGNLLENSGTGGFVVGPDYVEPTE